MNERRRSRRSGSLLHWTLCLALMATVGCRGGNNGNGGNGGGGGGGNGGSGTGTNGGGSGLTTDQIFERYQEGFDQGFDEGAQQAGYSEDQLDQAEEGARKAGIREALHEFRAENPDLDVPEDPAAALAYFEENCPAVADVLRENPGKGITFAYQASTTSFALDRLVSWTTESFQRTEITSPGDGGDGAGGDDGNGTNDGGGDDDGDDDGDGGSSGSGGSSGGEDLPQVESIQDLIDRANAAQELTQEEIDAILRDAFERGQRDGRAKADELTDGQADEAELERIRRLAQEAAANQFRAAVGTCDLGEVDPSDTSGEDNCDTGGEGTDACDEGLPGEDTGAGDGTDEGAEGGDETEEGADEGGDSLADTTLYSGIGQDHASYGQYGDIGFERIGEGRYRTPDGLIFDCNDPESVAPGNRYDHDEYVEAVRAWEDLYENEDSEAGDDSITERDFTPLRYRRLYNWRKHWGQQTEPPCDCEMAGAGGQEAE